MILRERLFEAVTECEGLTSAELCVLMDVGKDAVNKELLKLCGDGKLSRRKEGKPAYQKRVPFTYYKGTGTPQTSERKRKRKSLTVPTENGWRARFEEALRQVETLEEWKAEALRRYPDLAVPDVVFRARQIVAKAAPEHRQEALDGRLDKKPIMLATIAALEELS